MKKLILPLDYALISQAIYADDLHVHVEGPVPSSTPEIQNQLKKKDWKLIEFIKNPSGYIAGIWVNDIQNHIVIAHRGSLNPTSWVTDIETVIQKKPGSFVKEVIELLTHPQILEYRKRGYRLSTTGHSLGGFLAQISVFWSQRPEFPETYYPAMSAMVFECDLRLF